MTQHNYLTKMANVIIDNDTGKKFNHCQLSKNPNHKKIWKLICQKYQKIIQGGKRTCGCNRHHVHHCTRSGAYILNQRCDVWLYSSRLLAKTIGTTKNDTNIGRLFILLCSIFQNTNGRYNHIQDNN